LVEQNFCARTEGTASVSSVLLRLQLYVLGLSPNSMEEEKKRH
jgi:hypothetical protein